jgi:hypothetical protein
MADAIATGNPVASSGKLTIAERTYLSLNEAYRFTCSKLSSAIPGWERLAHLFKVRSPTDIFSPL